MKPIRLSYNEFVKEHKHLLKVLKSGSKMERNKEANKQLKELKNIMKK